MKSLNPDKINNYIKHCKDEYSRYTSWDNCYKAFATSKTKKDNLALELAFFLASWGMYRGSSGLLQKNHLIHNGAVDILFKKENIKLRCSKENEVNRNDIDKIIKLKEELADYYNSILFQKEGEKEKSISGTDTLLSKILLGTFTCVPAFDRYFKEGWKEIENENIDFNIKSLNKLFDFIENNKKEISRIQKDIFSITNKYYPIMKIIDMYFWQIGYDKNNKITHL